MSASWEGVARACERLRGRVHQTPVFTSTMVNEMTGMSVFFKAENLQKTGSFKFRGALNALLALDDQQAAKGVVTHSSGNHGQAVAAASKIRGCACAVVVPSNAPPAKVNAIRGYGSRVLLCAPTQQARLDLCEEEHKRTGAVVIPPYNHPDVICGQATIAVEFLEQVKHLDALLVAVGGGGLIGGVAMAAKHVNPNVRVFAVEPEGKKLGASLQAGKPLWEGPESMKQLDTVADAIRTQPLGSLTFPIVHSHVQHTVLTVTNAQIVHALWFTMERLKLVVEPAAAAVVAALLDEKNRSGPLKGCKSVGLVLCGGNVDMSAMKEGFAKAAKL